MSLLNKLALGSLAAFALLRTKRKVSEPVAAAEPAKGAGKPAKRARRTSAKRRAPARRVKSA